MPRYNGMRALFAGRLPPEIADLIGGYIASQRRRNIRRRFRRMANRRLRTNTYAVARARQSAMIMRSGTRGPYDRRR